MTDAFSRASRSANARGSSPDDGFYGISVDWAVNGIPAAVNNSRRRGEADARINLIGSDCNGRILSDFFAWKRNSN